MSPEAWKDVLELKGLTLTQVADLADVQRPSLSGLAGGYARAAAPMAHKIAAALGISPITLFPTMRSTYVEVEEAAA